MRDAAPAGPFCLIQCPHHPECRCRYNAAWRAETADPLATELTELRATVARLEAEKAALKADAVIMACALQGRTPDRNTQTPDEVTATEAIIESAIDRHLPNRPARAALDPQP